jgi:glutaminase
MNYEKLFSDIHTSISKTKNSGKVANYIPELSSVNTEHFAVHLSNTKLENFSYGNSNERFSIQSIAKVFSLILAYKEEDSDLWERVGVEPSGTSFNSLVLLEHDKGIPRNPFINAGALVICDIILSMLKNPKADFLNFVQSLSNNKNIQYNSKIALSEKNHAYRNYAMINLMKSFGNIKNNIDDVMDFYFDLCSVEMNCKELADSFLFLASNGLSPFTGKEVLSPSKVKRINAIMLLCGFYDEAGDFAFKVGLAGKSAVSGGIVAICPKNYAIAVWSPKLNEKGNSHYGMQFLEQFTSETKESIF